MTPNPILTVLSTLNRNRVKYLLIGGQACIIYGAAEFSRDSDFILLGNMGNINCLRAALDELEAERIYFPPLTVEYLGKGHACHFRCGREDVRGLRIDVMSKLRGCDRFDRLWEKKETIDLDDQTAVFIIGLRDLVQSKKTQRDKDWLMLKRLVNNDILQREYQADGERVQWWFRECIDESVLIDLAAKYPEKVRENIKNRPLLRSAQSADKKKLIEELRKEEEAEREKDRLYWAPLRKELEVLRHSHLSKE